MRDPVGGSVEFHFVPILKLMSTLLIMGVFEDQDVKHILKLIEPTVFKEDEAVSEDTEEREGCVVSNKQGAELEEEEPEEEEEDMGEEEEEQEDEEEDEEHVTAEREDEESGNGGTEGNLRREEPKEAEDVGEGLLHMKLPESVKLQVSVTPNPPRITIHSRPVVSYSSCRHKGASRPTV